MSIYMKYIWNIGNTEFTLVYFSKNSHEIQ